MIYNNILAVWYNKLIVFGKPAIMFKTQEYLQNKYKSISLFQYQMLFFLFQVVLHPIRDQNDDDYHFFYSLKNNNETYII